MAPWGKPHFTEETDDQNLILGPYRNDQLKDDKINSRDFLP